MERISVDDSVCVGCGLCEAMYPDIFKVGKNGVAYVRTLKKKYDFSKIVGQCPVGAIKIGA